MPHQPRMLCLVIGADGVFFHVFQYGIFGRIRTIRLDAAMCNLYDLVRALFEKSGNRPVFPRCNGKLCLVSVTLAGRRRCDWNHLQRLSAKAIECVRHALRLERRLGIVVQMPEVAAAALLCMRTQAVDTVR